MPQYKMCRREIEEIISKVQFRDRTFVLLDKGDGFLLQMRYMEADVEKPGSEPMLQSTRKYYISPYMTESELVETLWLCVQRSQLHVASEHFTYQGRRIYSQHFSVQRRIDMCDSEYFDVREPLSSRKA
jgi:hypothetical protein